MDKNAIKKYAVWARRELISRVSQRALQYGVSEKEIIDADVESVHGNLLSDAEKRQRKALIARVKKMGYEQTMEEAAYTWFNRFIALRFMEVNGYLPTHIRVFTDEENSFKPQILAEAIHLDPETMPGLDMEKIYAYKDKNQTDELFKYLIITQCNALINILPGMFTRINDYTELLFPDNILREGSVIEQMIALIPQADWDVNTLDERGQPQGQVQIIGWLYQYYNTEPKDKVFADLKKNIKISKENIPAATQLFTPDWIVRYMVENSLGRLWLEQLETQKVFDFGHVDFKNFSFGEDEKGSITKKQAALKSEWKYYLEEAKQDEDVEKQLYELRMSNKNYDLTTFKFIDPCMGSGHILVYAFDVFMQIYLSEGWNQREAAASIVQNNLYGLDIDDRAAQLAYFAVMMKARQYDRRFFTRRIQPHVHAIIDSEWTGGAYQHDMGNFLLSKEHQETLNYLLNMFRDAKEYGSIMQLEDRDYAGLADAWKYAASQTAENVNMMLWYSAVESIVPQLIQQAIMLSQKYDVVVTNPPYMGSSGMSTKLSQYVIKKYPKTKSDLSTVFMERALSLCKQDGIMSMINIPVWMFLISFESQREDLVSTNTFSTLLHFGRGIFGSDFGTVAFSIRKSHTSSYYSLYMRLFDKPSSVDSLEQKESWFFARKGLYTIQQENFSKIAGTPIAYWVSAAMLKAFSAFPSLGRVSEPKQGLITGDNDRFLREWYEVAKRKINSKWFIYNKGGDYRKWYGNNDLVVNWGNNGFEITNFVNAETGKQRSRPQNTKYYFREGFSWTTLSIGAFSARYMPAGQIFDAKGSSCFADNAVVLKALLGLTNSKVSTEFYKILSPTVDYSAGSIGKLPVASEILSNAQVIDKVDMCIELSRNDWDSFEISWDFQRHPLVEYSKSVAKAEINPDWANQSYFLKNAYEVWEYQCKLRFDTLKANEEELNRIFIDIYSLQDELTPEVEDKDVTVRLADKKRDIRFLISYAVGCMFGRYSLDEPGLILAGYDRVEYTTKTYDGDDPELEKFATVNPDGSKSYGSSYRWVNQERYKSFPIDVDNVIPICDDEYFDDDIVARFVRFIEVVYGKETLDENLHFIADALGDSGQPKDVIRNYFLNDFYADHLKIYQKRPIYWLFDSGKKGGFKALIYMHRYQPDTIARIRTDYVFEQQARYRTAIADLEQRMANAATSERVKLTKQLQKLQAQDAEIRTYEEKIHHLADQMIPIDLDDGVKHNYEIFKDVLAPIK